ncbi:1-deoxy-D-xylulose-5-phosphate synthase [Flavicella sp.]|uniref:1-deoxy-D-xylulose-5-phosphate synthase n=1 Tax=Flavicella sp. TaxID=2957742 RepID=UPI002609B42E|nr:1-deoxy-D-xylulose-5-phosphate synthase [Flavicella sp.]MDG1805209.1 1-deoxy-D-xylulose-5-phosphate synthase [Flavicella sp.]
MTKTLLNNIANPEDLRKIAQSDLPFVAKELRESIIDFVATKEGHLGASLGVIELTIALHYVFNTPKDSLIWDVGHQAYAHKILTDRKKYFHTNRQLNGLSGFPKRTESPYDSFGTGHSSTSISAALGMAMASKIKGDFNTQHIAVIGDASIASGMAFEGLNHAGVTDANLLVILNDNAMGIDPSVGALKKYLMKAKIGQKAPKGNMIEALNFNYSGPIDGHDLPKLIKELERLRKIQGTKFLHIVTTKGKGLKQAEQEQIKYHAPGKFDKLTGEILPKKSENKAPKYQDVFGLTLLELAKQNKKIVGITPAMPTGSSLKYMIEDLPERAFDVGIAEQHAVTLAAGMATQGLIPYCTIYSTFLQRAYDQIIHDVAIQNLPVIFCIDRAGLVGQDGATHHGVFDISYLRCIPNLIIFAPQNEIDLRNILYTVQLGKLENPITIRYPRGKGNIENWQMPFEEIPIGKGRTLREGTAVAILSIGTIGTRISEIIDTFPETEKQKIAHFNLLFVKPLDKTLLDSIFTKFDRILTIEDNTIKGGFGSSIIEFSQENNFANKRIKTLGIPDEFIEHGTTYELLQSINLDNEGIKTEIKNIL